MSGRRRPAVALATSRDVPSLSPDDRLLLAPLAARGRAAEPVVWNDPDVDWAAYDAVVVRSCWDYHHHIEAFEEWARRLDAAGTRAWNIPALLRWNARKTYLRKLAERGVPVVPTCFATGASPGLPAILRETGWDEVVVKPVVSASAHETWRTRGGEEDAARFAALARRGELMVQPFLREIERDGEWSLCFFAGRFSHAVLKRPAPGDFRVQSEHGGAYETVVPGPGLVREAARALAAAGAPTVYARVDGCVVDGVLRLMELELIEPGLFLAYHPEAPDRFADAILRGPGTAQE